MNREYNITKKVNNDYGLISIIIPTYNRKEIVEESINSVLAQTYNNIEVIVVDDCSDDGTTEYLEKKINDIRVSIVRMDFHKGACAARNSGINLAKGQYIAFQDSDDLWEKDKLEKQIDALLKNDADICFCRFRHVNIKGNEDMLIPSIEENRFVSTYELQRTSIASTQTIVGHAKCFENIAFDTKMPRLQDYDLVIRLSEKYRFYYLCEPLVIQRIQQDSISTQSSKRIIACGMILDKYRHVFDQNPDGLRNMNLTIIDSLGDQYRNEIIDRDKRITELWRQNQELETAAKKYEKKMIRTKRQLDAIKKSISWKITKPFRKTMTTVRKLFSWKH